MITDMHIKTLWRTMTRLYGHRWITNYGQADDGTWLRVLQNLDPQHIGRGVEKCLDNHRDWPPTLPQFRDLCKGIQRGQTFLGTQQQALPVPKRTKEVGQAAIKKISQLVGRVMNNATGTEG